ncbi:MAG: YkgJ family cysteine cluster protein, partial [Polyangiales bacterium]
DAGLLHAVHAARLQCKRGCSGCCVDDLTVFAEEAAPIRAHHAALLTEGAPHAIGACAFLDGRGACRIYADRPYVCRTQGLPMRWLVERRETAETGAERAVTVELRDICPLNETDVPSTDLPSEQCWTIGPVEERLALLQLSSAVRPARVALRDLFVGKR